jgi:hypothetical protein
MGPNNVESHFVAQGKKVKQMLLRPIILVLL